jgi:hypothetical protein
MMSTRTLTQLVDELVRAKPLAPERFAALLGTPLTPGEANPFWQRYSFTLSVGAFTGGELRLNTERDGALLILEPRDPPGLRREEVDRADLGPVLAVRPNPEIPPEGLITESFQKNGVQVALQWTAQSRRLYSLVLEWAAP